jgi:hypothetical protein
VAEVTAEQGRPEAPLAQITLAVWSASHGAALLGVGEAGVIDEVIVGLEALFRPPLSASSSPPSP